METVARLTVIPPQPPQDTLVPLLASFLTDHARPASALSAYLPTPVLSELEARMAASISAATLKASQR